MNPNQQTPAYPQLRSCHFMTDREIQQKCELTSKQREQGHVPLITPFISQSVSALPDGRRGPSYGLSSFGYDIRLSNTFDVRNPRRVEDEGNFLVEPRNDSQNVYHKTIGMKQGHHRTLEYTQDVIDFANQANNIGDGGFTRFSDIEWIDLPPLSFTLAVSMEYFNVPNNAKGICMGKSTVARNGIHVFVTPLEPGWSGFLTLEIANMTRSPVRVYSGMGITQIMFVSENTEPDVTYADRAGKYQHQPELPVHAITK